MTKTRRHAGRAIRTMLRVEALMHQAENTGRWDDYRALNGTYLESYNRARRAGVSEQRMLSIGQ